MSRVAGLTEEGLEASYRSACNGSMFSTRQGSALDEDELEEIPAPATEDCVGLVSRIHHERDLIDPAKEPEATETSDPDKHEDEVDAAPVLPNKDDDLSAVLEAAAQVPEPTKEKDAKDVFPRTLASALDQGVGGGDFTFWNSLWRFSVFLRCEPKGIDTGFLRNCRNCRRASRKLNWYQYLGLRYLMLVCMTDATNFSKG